MTTFSAALRQHISRGLAPASAMRATWAEVRQGRVAPPPRHPVSGPRGITRRQAALMRREAGNPYFIGLRDDLTTEVRHFPTAKAEGILKLPWLQAWGPYESKAYAKREAAAIERRMQSSGWPSRNPTRRYSVRRIESPSHFDPRSFRTVTPRRGVRVTIGCPKGKYHRHTKRCGVGTRAQRVMVRRRNPLTRKEVGYALAGARASLSASRRLPSLTAPQRQDPIARARHRGWWRGRADGLLGAVQAFGPPRKFRRGAQMLQRFTGPNPWRGAQLYDRVLEIRAQKGRGSKFPGQRFVHKFRTRARMIGLANGDILITGRR